MKQRSFLFLLVCISASIGLAQQTATLKITDIHVTYDGQEYNPEGEIEVKLDDHNPTSAIIFEIEGVKYGVDYQYKKGRNRIRLVRWGYVIKNGMEPKRGKKEKDMQNLKISVTGSFSKRAVDNIMINRDNLESINITYKYELIYK